MNVIIKVANKIPPTILKGKAKKLVDPKIVGEFSPKLTCADKLYLPIKNPDNTKDDG